MEQNSNNFSMQDAMRLAKSPAGQQLLEMIKKADSAKLQQAVDHFRSGNTEGAKSALSEIFSDPKAKQLLEQMGK